MKIGLDVSMCSICDIGPNATIRVFNRVVRIPGTKKWIHIDNTILNPMHKAVPKRDKITTWK